MEVWIIGQLIGFFLSLSADFFVSTGELTSMRQQKNEVQNVRKEMECGLQFSDPSVIPKSGDQVLCYQEKEVSQTLEWDMEF